MSSDNVFDQVVGVVAEQLGVSKEEIKKEADIVDDLGADSLDTVELVMALEEEFEVEISDEDAEKLKTINDVLEYVESRLKK